VLLDAGKERDCGEKVAAMTDVEDIGVSVCVSGLVTTFVLCLIPAWCFCISY
jgi:hypothetical protein